MGGYEVLYIIWSTMIFKVQGRKGEQEQIVASQ